MANPTKVLRALALGGAGLATFYVAAQWSRSAKGTDEIVMPAAPAPMTRVAPGPVAAAASSVASSTSGPAALALRAVPSVEGQAFARLSWLPPPPPPPPPPPAPVLPPPPPSAPPLPFTFVGMVEKGVGKPQAFLSRGEALLVVSAGDLVDGNTYRIESISDSQVVITYVPLNIKQTIDVANGPK